MSRGVAPVTRHDNVHQIIPALQGSLSCGRCRECQNGYKDEFQQKPLPSLRSDCSFSLSSFAASLRASSTANLRMYAVTARPAACARCDNRSTSCAMLSAFVARSCRQNSKSLVMIRTHATGSPPTQIRIKRANQSNAYGAPPHARMLAPFSLSHILVVFLTGD
jgi:hypothetical protein